MPLGGHSSQRRPACGRSGRHHAILLLPFHRRFVIYTLSIVLTVLFAALAWTDPVTAFSWQSPHALFGGLAALGTADLIQTRHAVLRNYPISAHLRFLLAVDPPGDAAVLLRGRQGRAARSAVTSASVVYQRAKKILDKRPFGTQYDVYSDGYEWMRHSLRRSYARASNSGCSIGGPDCR